MLLQTLNPLNDSPLIFPALECAHIIGFAMSIGTIAVLGFRPLGLGLMRHPPSELAKDLAPWTLVGIHALVFRRGVFRNTAAPDVAPRIPKQAKFAASLSLILWTSLVIAGRGIGYIEPPLDKIHARLFAAPAIASTAVPAERRFQETHARIRSIDKSSQ
jgi:hypothetical protein